MRNLYIHVGDQVQARNYGIGAKWTKGIITKKLGTKHYLVDIGGEIWKRHIDQLITCTVTVESDQEKVQTPRVWKYEYEPEKIESSIIPEIVVPTPGSEETVPESAEIAGSAETQISNPIVSSSAIVSPSVVVSPSVKRSYPTRGSKNVMPSKFNDFGMDK